MYGFSARQFKSLFLLLSLVVSIGVSTVYHINTSVLAQQLPLSQSEAQAARNAVLAHDDLATIATTSALNDLTLITSQSTLSLIDSQDDIPVYGNSQYKQGVLYAGELDEDERLVKVVLGFVESSGANDSESYIIALVEIQDYVATPSTYSVTDIYQLDQFTTDGENGSIVGWNADGHEMTWSVTDEISTLTDDNHDVIYGECRPKERACNLVGLLICSKNCVLISMVCGPLCGFACAMICGVSFVLFCENACP